MDVSIKLITLIAPFLVCISAVHAEGASPALDEPPKAKLPETSVFDDPLAGIIVNRTVTVLGNDFYQYFSSAWREQDGNNKYSISVYERPSARFGSEIWIQYRQNRVFHIFLSPARQAARGVGKQAAEIVQKNIMQSEIQRVLYQSQDLAQEEL